MDSASDGSAAWRTERLALVPISTSSVVDLVDLHRDDGIAAWYGGDWTADEAGRFATAMEKRWRADRLGKWLAYDLGSGRLIGRGGPTRTNAVTGGAVEVGWAVRWACWGHGYASEIGRASIDYASHVDPTAPIVAFTERHNERSRAVMHRLGMIYAAEIERPGLIEGLTGVHERAPFALYRMPGAS